MEDENPLDKAKPPEPPPNSRQKPYMSVSNALFLPSEGRSREREPEIEGPLHSTSISNTTGNQGPCSISEHPDRNEAIFLIDTPGSMDAIHEHLIVADQAHHPPALRDTDMHR